MRVTAVRHTLMEHPLLQFPNLVALAKRLAESQSVRSHHSSARFATNFEAAPTTHPAPLSPEETVRHIERAEAWLSLLNIQRDPLYRTLVDEVLDHLQPRIEARDTGMHHRAGWIFIASPGAVTPFHFDHENNFIFQILGRKRVYVWDPLDSEVVTEEALEAFHGHLSRTKLHWRDEHLGRAQSFDFEPGAGAYMPQTAPHLVENGSGPSVTLSVTYYSNATRRRQSLYRANAQLRRLGLRPRPVNRLAPGQPVKRALWDGYRWGRRRAAPWQGRAAEDVRSRYSDRDQYEVVY